MSSSSASSRTRTCLDPSPLRCSWKKTTTALGILASSGYRSNSRAYSSLLGRPTSIFTFGSLFIVILFQLSAAFLYSDASFTLSSALESFGGYSIASPISSSVSIRSTPILSATLSYRSESQRLVNSKEAAISFSSIPSIIYLLR